MSGGSIMDQLTRERKALSVSELTARIRSLLERQFMDVWVAGEISNFHRHSSGHWYFTLKDDRAMIKCACFKTQNRLIRFKPDDGLTVRARGRVSVYDSRGEYQILVEYMEPAGAGALQLAFEQLKAKLEAEGLFDTERKRTMPLLPRRIGVVTSPTGAAVADILRVIRRRNEAMSVLVAPARVQGEGAAIDIARAIRALNSHGGVDVIIVGRGGGATEDLHCFNEEIVARAIFHSKIPVISAVGHETDFTIADFVADLRASTPSAAAEMVTAARDDLDHRIKTLSERMTAAVRRQVMELRGGLSKVESGRVFARMPIVIRTFVHRLDDAASDMESAVRRSIRKWRVSTDAAAMRLKDADIRVVLASRRAGLALAGTKLESATKAALGRDGERLSVIAGKLESMSPLAVLSRGYAIAFDARGKIIKTASAATSGDQLKVRVSDGNIDCTVD
jgi:exodeoxyribonuclease VII large subunit